jgi:hypothetical protein
VEPAAMLDAAVMVRVAPNLISTVGLLVKTLPMVMLLATAAPSMTTLLEAWSVTPISTSSDEVGTPAGDQLLAVSHLPSPNPLLFVQVLVTASAGAASANTTNATAARAVAPVTRNVIGILPRTSVIERANAEVTKCNVKPSRAVIQRTKRRDSEPMCFKHRDIRREVGRQMYCCRADRRVFQRSFK